MSRSTVAAILILFALSGTAFGDYYSGSGTGWWWYDREEKQEAEKPEPEAPPQVQPRQQAPAKQHRLPSLDDYTYEQLWSMHPDDFYELQEDFKKRAVQDASENNVREYYEVQEIARKKALAFTNTAQYVWQKYPELTTAKDYPITTPGNLAQVGQISDERQKKLRQYKDSFALIYFTKEGCPYCVEQEKILKWFQSSTEWTVKPIDIGQNPELASKFGITMTPSLILVQRGKQDHFPVSSGVISATEIEDKTYRAVRLLTKEISPEEYSIYDFQKGGGYDVREKEFPTKKRRDKK